MNLSRWPRAGTAGLPVEGSLPNFDGPATWLNSGPLTAADLRGHVVLVNFWTFSCVNWIRTAPYLRTWNDRYRDSGLIMIGVHTPEFPFERDIDGISAALEERRLEYPVVVDSDYAIWRAFRNNYWPALYIADGDGAIRFHHFGEGRYEDSESAIQQLLNVPHDLRSDSLDVETRGIEAPADWDALNSPETYVGWERAERFASPGGPAFDQPRNYNKPARMPLNGWALSGEWTIGPKAARLNQAGGSLSYRFRARDINLVMGPADAGQSVRFHVRIEGGAPGAAHGSDVDEDGEGSAVDRRLYQLIRQPGRVDERTFEITFHEPGVEAYVFTFG